MEECCVGGGGRPNGILPMCYFAVPGTVARLCCNAGPQAARLCCNGDPQAARLCCNGAPQAARLPPGAAAHRKNYHGRPVVLRRRHTSATVINGYSTAW